jgi:hypothetical protein
MPSPVKLAGTLPAGDANGLAAIAAEVTSAPKSLRAVIALVDVKELRTSIDAGDIVPILRIKRIEAINPDDMKAARRLYRRALDKRTGREAIPFELEEDLDEAFGAGD